MNKHNLFTSNSNKLKFFLLKLFIIFLFIIVFCISIMPQYSEHYTASLIDKVERLENIEEAKVVLLGNSNLAFGINSQLMEEELKMPVVNMGLHAGLGNSFHEEMARINVCEGDIYVLCHTDYGESRELVDPVLAWIVLENNWNLWQILRTEDILPMIKAYPQYLRKCLDLYINENGNLKAEGVYFRDSFNEYGDVAYEREENEYEFTEVIPASVSDDTVTEINELTKWLEERGAHLVIAAYPIGAGEKTVDASEFIALQEELESKMDCMVISNFIDYMYEYRFFYDTEWHLTSEGADMRTRQLVQDILNWKKGIDDSGK